MQNFDFFAKIFVRRHKNFLRLTSRGSGWTAYKTIIRSWKQLEGLLPPSSLEKTIPNFGKFYDAVFEILLKESRRRKYQNAAYRKKKIQRDRCSTK